VAHTHYLQTTEVHFKQAQIATQNGADLVAECQSTLELETKKASAFTEALLQCAPVDSLVQILKGSPE
jgi:hypothetical protein